MIIRLAAVDEKIQNMAHRRHYLLAGQAEVIEKDHGWLAGLAYSSTEQVITNGASLHPRTMAHGASYRVIPRVGVTPPGGVLRYTYSRQK